MEVVDGFIVFYAWSKVLQGEVMKIIYYLSTGDIRLIEQHNSYV